MFTTFIVKNKYGGKQNLWPNGWKTSVFVVLPLNKGDLAPCSSHHAVALVSQAIKILQEILMKRMQEKTVIEIKSSRFHVRCRNRNRIFNLRMFMEI